MALPPTVHIYGGACDGKSGVTLPSVRGFGVWQGEPGKSVLWDYQISNEWSAYFDKPTAVPVGFPGKPPREKAAA